MRKVLDEEEVRTAFEEFLASPKAPIACEVEGDVEEQKRAEEALMRGMNLPLPARPAGMRIVDARRAVVPVECTMASYGEKWENGWMGQMVLESVVNVPYERCFIPLEVSDLVTLTDCAMMNLRIFNIHVQHCSRYLLLCFVDRWEICIDFFSGGCAGCFSQGGRARRPLTDSPRATLGTPSRATKEWAGRAGTTPEATASQMDGSGKAADPARLFFED